MKPIDSFGAVQALVSVHWLVLAAMHHHTGADPEKGVQLVKDFVVWQMTEEGVLSNEDVEFLVNELSAIAHEDGAEPVGASPFGGFESNWLDVAGTEPGSNAELIMELVKSLTRHGVFGHQDLMALAKVFERMADQAKQTH